MTGKSDILLHQWCRNQERLIEIERKLTALRDERRKVQQEQTRIRKVRRQLQGVIVS